jgi:hypothetical protein
MAKQLTTAGASVIGPACKCTRSYNELTASEKELLALCNGNTRLLRVALRTAIRERAKLIGRP